MAEDGDVIETGGFKHDHPAQYDQDTAELARKLQMSQGFIVYIYTRTGEREDGSIEGEGHAVVGATPGIPLGRFLQEGVDSINMTIKSMVDSYKNGSCDHGETKG